VSTTEEISNFKQALRLYGARTARSLMSALLIWLFGVLVFIPMASSLGWNAELVCTLILLVAFSGLVWGAISGFKKIIDAFSVFPARKYLAKRGLDKENSVIVSRYLLYIFSTVVLFLLYVPFLMHLHPALGGIILVLVVLFVFFLTLKAIRASRKAFTNWLYSSKLD
jgi:hypothetical protein